MLAELVDHVIGVDPDRDWITAAVVDANTTGVIAKQKFSADAVGYDEAISWAEEFTAAGERAWAVEGTASYGRGLTAALARASEWVIEFDRPREKASKDGAKSDELDAVRAAREALGRDRIHRTASPRRAPRSPACAHRDTCRGGPGTHSCDQRTQSTRAHRSRRSSPRAASPHNKGAGKALRFVP